MNFKKQNSFHFSQLCSELRHNVVQICNLSILLAFQSDDSFCLFGV